MSLLVVQHQDSCPPGRVGTWLTEAGVELDVRRPYAGDPLPQDLSGHDGLLVLGGEMGCRDDEAAPWLRAVRELVRTAAKGATPTLGICLGHQLAAVALGGEVEVNPAGRTVGVLTVDAVPALAADPLFAGTDDAPVAQWNNDIVARLPDEAVELARNERGDLLLARLAPTVWGVQGHPEADSGIVGAWAAKDADSPAVADIDLPAALRRVEETLAPVERAWRPVAQAFAGLLTAR